MESVGEVSNGQEAMNGRAQTLPRPVRAARSPGAPSTRPARLFAAVSERISLPAGDGELQFIIHGRIAWFDPCLVRKFFLWPVYIGAFIALALASRNRRAPPAIRASIRNGVTLVASAVVCLGLIEF